MTAVVRKGVLLRFDPVLLERVDRCTGGLSRTEWLMQLIEREVIAFESAHEPADPPAQAITGATLYRVCNEDGSDMGLRACSDGNGGYELSAAEDAATRYTPANDANGDSGLGGNEPLGDAPQSSALEGPDNGAFTPSHLSGEFPDAFLGH